MGQTSPRNQQVQSSTSAEVPECPTLAPNVQLVGEMQGTGFEDRQWLIQRNGQFLQITELLYRVAEQANGKRNLEEIALKVTESTDWIISADNVRQIFQTKLIPMGIGASADGFSGSLVSHRGDRVRSPLEVGARVVVLSPRVIEPIASLLQILYTPPILVPVLMAAALAHGWLYLVHGMADSFSATVYTPGLLLVVLAVMFVEGVFHEFGHASALRYGGGRVRAMGAGLYLTYPVFYTDVTDSYRLSRWARVRTDLGGFYFDLMFALGILALYLATGQEFLLFIVFLVNLGIIYECLPFVRFDGYWALADLTGMPDFFSQMGPFLRRILPIPRREGSSLPNLKPWVSAVFAVYIGLTIPVLLFLLFLLGRSLPSIATTIWHSLLVQTAGFSTSLSNGNALGAAAAFSQALILALDILALIYLLYSLTWRLGRAIRNWSKPTPARYIAAVLVATGAIAAVLLLWIPNALP